MAVAVETTGGGSGVAGANATAAAFSVTSANIIFAAVTLGDETRVPNAPTRDGQTFTAVSGSDADEGVWTFVRWYYLLSPNTGSADVVTVGTGLDQLGLHVISFTGASTTIKTPSIFTTSSSSGSNPTLTVVDSADGDIVFGAMSHDGQAQNTGASGTVIADFDDLEGDTDHISQYVTASGANTVLTFLNTTAGERVAISGLAVGSAGGTAATRIPFVGSFGRKGGRLRPRYPMAPIPSWGRFAIPTLAERMRYAA